MKHREKFKFNFSLNLHNFSFALGQFQGAVSHLMLVWLPLSHSRLNNELAAVCIDSTKTNSTVTDMSLSSCGIDDASAAALAEPLQENSTLTSLELCDNAIGDVGADSLVKGLKKKLNADIAEFVLYCNWRCWCSCSG